MNVEDGLQMTHESLVNYHNTLVQIRFTVASLFIAAISFLVVGLIGDIKWHGRTELLPIMGVGITLVCWIIDIRTTHLLDNLAVRGQSIESKLSIQSDVGFFHLMTGGQPKGIRWPFLGVIKTNKITRQIVSHSFALNTIYLVFTAFWLNALYVEVTYVSVPAAVSSITKTVTK